MKRLFLSLFILLPCLSFSALQMRCISVGNSGDATFSWLNSSSAALFRSYHIYHATASAGPYTLIDSVNVYATQSYTDLSANAIAMNAYYFAELKNTNGTSELSDTIRAIRLNVTDPQNGYASLTWNSSHTPPIATNSIYHLIYREYPPGNNSLLDSINISQASPNYNDEIFSCGDTIKYQVIVPDASGCVSESSIDGDFFTNKIPPDAPVIDSVSMDVNGFAVIGWEQSHSGDTEGYIIYQTDGNTETVIDTVYGAGNTFYQTILDASGETQGFRIVAFDTCGNPCAANPLQRTILLQGSLDRCSRSMNLSWSEYVNSDSAPVYQIVVNENGGSDILAGTTTSTNFSVPGLKTDSTYCFRIVAELNGPVATSTSNAICIIPDLPVAPQYAYIRSVSVFPNDVVGIVGYVDPAADIMEYRLQRSETANGNFVTIQSQNFTAATVIEFTDAVPTNVAHYYRIASIDSCGNDALPSQVSRTLVADTLSTGNYVNVFDWNTYLLWASGISHYLVYRSVDGVAESSPMAMVTPFDTVFTDDVRDLYATSGIFCYYIVAYEAPGNPYGFADSARSNEICMRQKSSVYIPNAFRPEGVNSIFNPAEAFVGLDGYSLVIFNRFGEEIFKTSEPARGWDGTAKDHRCETGVYVYKLKAHDESGKDIERIGRVTLIR